MKHLVGKPVTKKIDFMDSELEIRKLSVKEVLAIQGLVKKQNKSKAEDSQLGLLRDILRIAVVGAEEMTDDDFDTFPLGDLSNITEEVMSYSGLNNSEEAGN
jgi:hypothetical protein